jgi:hypothetical protein
MAITRYSKIKARCKWLATGADTGASCRTNEFAVVQDWLRCKSRRESGYSEFHAAIAHAFSSRRPADAIAWAYRDQLAASPSGMAGPSFLAARSNVRFGSKGDIIGILINVRYSPESGHSPVRLECPLSAKAGCERVQQTRLIRSPRRRGQATAATTIASTSAQFAR